MATHTRSKKTRSHMANNSIPRLLDDFNVATKAPEKFISPQEKTASKLTALAKQLFDLSQQNLADDDANVSGLPELITKNFDDEQIWQELELHNDPFLRHSFQDVSRVIAGKDRCSFYKRTKKSKSSHDDTREEENVLEYSGSQDLFPEMQTQEDEDEDEDEDDDVKDPTDNVDDDDDDESGSETNFDINALEAKSKSKTRKKAASTTATKTAATRQGDRSRNAKSSVVDDQFFKLSEMDRFLELEDAKWERKRDKEEGKGKRRNDEDEEEDDDDDEGSLDHFKELPSEDEAGFDDEEDEEDEDEEQEGDLFSYKNAKDFKYQDYFHDDDGSQNKSVRFEGLESDEEEEDEDEDEEEDEEEEEDGDMEEEEDETEQDKSGHDAEARQALSGLIKDSDDDGSEGEDALDILGRRSSKPEEDDTKKSTFEKRQDRLKEKIAQLEEANISKKPWQLMGEVTAGKRPENSLLEVDLEYDATPKAGVDITEDTTKSLEDILRQRILDNAWDDVERKMKPKEDIHEYKKRVTLDQEKSKVSLAEIYEQEYIKQTQGEKEAGEDPAHVEIRTSMEALFLKLDALSNFHYTPKPAVAEVKIVSNLPSIAMEEVAPVTATDATLLAPQEIQEKQKGELKGDTERTEEDKNRARREKKLGQRERALAKEKRENEKLGLGNKSSKRAAMEKLEKSSKVASNRTTIIKDSKSRKKSLTSSKSFFSQLQDEVTAQVHGLKDGKRRKTENTQMSAARLKL